MALPVRATLLDVTAVSRYLASKPTGATVSDAKRVLDAKHLDPRKITAFKSWGFVADEGGRLKVSPRGRLAIKDESAACREVLSSIEAYHAILERADHRNESSLSATEIAAHWHEHYPNDASDNDEVLNEQAIAFLQIIEGAALGNIVIGRRGSATRIELNIVEVAAYLGQDPPAIVGDAIPVGAALKITQEPRAAVAASILAPTAQEPLSAVGTKTNRVFITHGKNAKILAQLKDIVTFGKLQPVIAEEHETVSKPVPDKVMDDMRSCSAGVIHVAGEQVLIDDKGDEHHKINDNVLIEIGAAMALYRRNVILLVEKSVQLPSNLQGLYECRYEGDRLDGDATMKLLKAFNDFSY